MQQISSVTLFLLTVLPGCNPQEKSPAEKNNYFITAFTPPMNTSRFRLFDSDWKFYKGELTGAEMPGFDYGLWRKIDLPHDWSIEDLSGQKDGEIIGPFDKNSIGLFYTGYTIGGTGWYREYPGWNWPGNEGKMMKVRVYTKFNEVSLELNGKLIATQTATPDNKFTYVFNVPYESGELKAIAVSEGREQVVKSLITTGPVEKVKIIPDRTIISTNRNDLAYLTIELSDSEGNLVNDAMKEINFDVSGVAEIAAVDNGNPRDPKSFQSNSCTTFHGRCMVILRPKGKPGKVTLTAYSEDLTPSECTVEIK